VPGEERFGIADAERPGARGSNASVTTTPTAAACGAFHFETDACTAIE